MTIVNLTCHKVDVYDKKKNLIKSYPPQGIECRIDEKRTASGEIDGVPLIKKQFSNPVNLPEPSPNVAYIVSSQVVDTLRGKRSDIMAPDGLIRDEDGRIIGCTQFWHG